MLSCRDTIKASTTNDNNVVEASFEWAEIRFLIAAGLAFVLLTMLLTLTTPARIVPIPMIQTTLICSSGMLLLIPASFVPVSQFALLLIIFVEGRTDASMLVHGLCIALTLGRIIHAYGVSQVKESLRLRVSGMILTLGTIIYAALRLIVSYLV